MVASLKVLNDQGHRRDGVILEVDKFKCVPWGQFLRRGRLLMLRGAPVLGGRGKAEARDYDDSPGPLSVWLGLKALNLFFPFVGALG